MDENNVPVDIQFPAQEVKDNRRGCLRDHEGGYAENEGRTSYRPEFTFNG